MTGASAFSSDYDAARARFRASARRARARLESLPIGYVGPKGEDLTIDVALLGAERPSRVVIVSSGLHGVEGFLGSAVQAAWLEGDLLDWSANAPEGLGLVLLHALDPYGFAWIRRVNEHNIDLNRNGLIDGETYEGSPELYGTLDPWLNARTPPKWFSSFLFWSAVTVARYGMYRLKDAIAGGQYDYPLGLFFGGHELSLTHRLLAEHLPRWIGAAKHVLHVDFHTGLGRWGTYKLLIDESQVDRASWLTDVFGANTVEISEPSGISYHSRGDLGWWCQRQLFPDRVYDTLCAEFGTYPPIQVLAALRAENRARHWGHPDDPSTIRATRRLKEVFIPESPRWRDETVTKGLTLVRRALEVYSGPRRVVLSVPEPEPEARAGSEIP